MKRNVLLLPAYILFWFIIDYVFQLSANRTFTLVDDHTIISTYDYISNFGAIDYILKEVLPDTERFRPMMGINRAFYVSIFGTDLRLISYYFLLLAGIAGFFLHKFGEVIGFSFKKSVLLSALVLFGMQSVVWWVFDSSENIATMFMSIALYTGYQAFENRKSARFLIPIFWVSILLMSFSKESFIFILPFFAILFRKRGNVVVLLILICLLELLYIKFFIGTTFGYAGVDNSTYSFYNISKVIAQYMIRGYGIPLVCVVGILSYQNRGNLKFFWLKNKIYILIVLVGIMPFLLLYAKSGINVGRYLLPLLVPQVYVLFYLAAQLRKSKDILVIGAITLLIFGYHVFKFTQLQHDFVTENKMIQNFSNEIKLRTDSTEDILVLANPVEDFEKAGALMIYLKSENALNRTSAKLEIIDLPGYSESQPVYQEFKFRNSAVLNEEPRTKYKKWLVLNDNVLDEITSKGFLKTPHTLTQEGSYAIIVFI